VLKGHICYSESKNELITRENAYVVCVGGKSKGVFSNIINIVKQIDPDVLNGALYVHATEKAAKEANAETGLNGTALERTKFLQWVSSDWKDTKDNIKTE
jgi:hypothetical protein